MAEQEQERRGTATAEGPDPAQQDREREGLAASAARLRQIVSSNESRMLQLQQFVRRLEELTGSLLSPKSQTPQEPSKSRAREGDDSGG